ncbi:hypothetical protein ABPG73_008379, partial [Tetrahymena malaccensis]
YNSITTQAAKHIACSLEKCQNLTQLNIRLRSNKICDEGAICIVNSLEKCQQIQKLKLDFGENNINDLGEIRKLNFTEKDQKITNLTLDLSFNQIGQEGAKNIGEYFQNFQRITHLCLNLSCNSIGDYGAKHIGMSLEKCQGISELNLNLQRLNKLGDQGVENIANFIENCHQMSSLNLNLQFNSITGEGARNLAISFENFKSQFTEFHLDLRDNIISDEGVQQITNSLENCLIANKIQTLSILGFQGSQDIGRNIKNRLTTSGFNIEKCDQGVTEIVKVDQKNQEEEFGCKQEKIFSKVFKANNQAITLCYNNIRKCNMSLLEINKKSLNRDDYLTSKYLNNIGYCYLQLNEYSNSLKYYLESFQLLSNQKKENKHLKDQKKQALLYLYINYFLLGDEQEADKYRQADPLLQKQAEVNLLIFQKRKQNLKEI